MSDKNLPVEAGRHTGSNVSQDKSEVKDLAPTKSVPPGFSNREEWVGFQVQVGTALKGGLLPESIKTAGQAVTIALKGRELGLDPLYALSQIHMIKGKPTLSAEVMLALIYKRQPSAKGCIHFLTPFEKRNEECVIEVELPGGKPEQFGFTVSDAVEAGLLIRKSNGEYVAAKGKDNWMRYRASMLRARAISIMARAKFAELIGGVYTEDELTPPQPSTQVEDAAELDAELVEVENATPPPPEPAEEADTLDAEFRETEEVPAAPPEPAPKAAQAPPPAAPPKSNPPEIPESSKKEAEPPQAKAVEMPQAEPVVKPAKDPGNYLIQFGRLTGKRINECERIELESYVGYLKTRKVSNPNKVKELISNIEAYLVQG